ncbi:MAG: lysophospholipid acyltransferase family protein [Anaerosomatales bacterium]|nr:lysophospholipid acyltransferase family protein [Anaerosomatales bacterium]
MNQPVGRFVRATIGKLVLALFRVRTVGVERIPEGGAVLAGNHVSYMDPVTLWCAGPRPVHFMAKRELWEGWFLGWLLPRLWAFPVTRGEVDRAAIERATAIVREGGLVGIFPEGTRAEADVEAPGEAHGGAAFIALRGGVPVVPVAFIGTDRVMPRGAKLPRLGRVTIRFGVPIPPDEVEAASRKERVRALTDAVMAGIAAELAAGRGEAS